MNAHTSDFHIPDSNPAGGVVSARSSGDSLAGQWDAVHDAAAAVAALAGLEPEAPSRHQRDFPALIMSMSGWKQDLARNGLNDIAAIMRPGLTALLAVSARGQDPAAAATTLWYEFLYARDALLELAPDDGASDPKRSA